MTISLLSLIAKEMTCIVGFYHPVAVLKHKLVTITAILHSSHKIAWYAPL